MKYQHSFEVVLDVDDVLLDCNRYALSLLSERDGVPYSIDRVTDWGMLGIAEDERLTFLEHRDFYLNQPPLPGAVHFLRTLCSVANVTIMTAVYPQFMGERIRRLGELFPWFPQENILMGKRKEMLQADVMLDDGVHNLYQSSMTLPVLFRQPWNRHVSGLCSINYYHEFLSLIEIMQGNHVHTDHSPAIICIVGPSGSGKNRLAGELSERDGYTRIETFTTCTSPGKTRTLSEEEFDRRARAGFFLETTYYGRQRYGLPREEISQALARGENAVAVMDISGCMAVHNHFPGQGMIVYLERDKRACIESILEKEKLPKAETIDRILSFDFEEKNKILADLIVREDRSGGFDSALRQIEDWMENKQ